MLNGLGVSWQYDFAGKKSGMSSCRQHILAIRITCSKYYGKFAILLEWLRMKRTSDGQRCVIRMVWWVRTARVLCVCWLASRRRMQRAHRWTGEHVEVNLNTSNAWARTTLDFRLGSTQLVMLIVFKIVWLRNDDAASSPFTIFHISYNSHAHPVLRRKHDKIDQIASPRTVLVAFSVPRWTPTDERIHIDDVILMSCNGFS